MPILMQKGILCQTFVVSLSHNSLKTHTLYKHKLKNPINTFPEAVYTDKIHS